MICYLSMQLPTNGFDKKSSSCSLPRKKPVSSYICVVNSTDLSGSTILKSVGSIGCLTILTLKVSVPELL